MLGYGVCYWCHYSEGVSSVTVSRYQRCHGIEISLVSQIITSFTGGYH